MPTQVEDVTAHACTVPTDLPEGDGTLAWSETTLVVTQVRCGDAVGTGWTYGPRACVAVIDDHLTPAVVGTDAMSVPQMWQSMVRATRNMTVAGVVAYAISAVDVALWDLKAHILGIPLVDLFGQTRSEVPVYGSGGFTTYDDEQTRSQLRRWVDDLGMNKVKIKIGESWGAAEDRDVERMRLAREVIGPQAELFVDANGGYSAKQAVRVMRRVRDLDVRWLEEPVSSQDLSGLAQVRGLVDADVTAGEYGSDVAYFERLCAAGAVDCLQADATRAGGYTGWFRAAAVAAAHNLQVSAHTAPNLHAPAAAATHNLRHLEWFHDHERIESTLFHGALDPRGGKVVPKHDRPGHGLVLNEQAAEARAPNAT